MNNMEFEKGKQKETDTKGSSTIKRESASMDQRCAEMIAKVAAYYRNSRKEVAIPSRR